MKFQLNFIPNVNKSVVLQYLILLFFWTILTGLFIAGIILFIIERDNVNQANNVNSILNEISQGTITDKAQIQNYYKQFMNISYPLIDFSLLAFGLLSFGNSSGITDWSEAWSQRQANINTAYSYIFITALIAMIAWVIYAIIIAQIIQQEKIKNKYKLSPEYPGKYTVFNTKIYLDFIVNLAIVFSFFNFLSTIISLVYGILLVIVSYVFWYGFKIHSEILTPHMWWKAKNFAFFTVVIIVQNLISILKVIFLKNFNVNLDLIIQIVFPIGTITVIISVFIKNMLSSKITSVKNDIKNINNKISSFRMFFYTQGEKSLEDYSFVSQLPKLIKSKLVVKNIDVNDTCRLMSFFDEITIFVNNTIDNLNEKRYMLYYIYNNVDKETELANIKNNILNIKANQKITLWSKIKAKY